MSDTGAMDHGQIEIQKLREQLAKYHAFAFEFHTDNAHLRAEIEDLRAELRKMEQKDKERARSARIVASEFRWWRKTAKNWHDEFCVAWRAAKAWKHVAIGNRATLKSVLDEGEYNLLCAESSFIRRLDRNAKP